MAKAIKKTKTTVKKPVKKSTPKKDILKKMERYLVLRNCNPDGSSSYGFVWNTEIGAVNTAPDFQPTQEYGNGLHGWENGIGDATVSSYNDSPLWLVLDVPSLIQLDGKVKFESCIVVFKGSKSECAKYLYDQGIRGAIIGLTGDFAEGGDYSALSTSENNRTQTAGNYSSQKAGNYSSQTAGHESTQKAGYGSTQKAGDYSNISCWNRCKVTAGIGSTVTHRWYDGQYRVAIFLITELEANKTYYYENGKQTLLPDNQQVTA